MVSKVKTPISKRNQLISERNQKGDTADKPVSKNDWSLSSLTESLDNQDKVRKNKEEAQLVELRKQTQELDPSKFSNKDLLALFEQTLPECYTGFMRNPEFSKLYTIACDKLRTEIFIRMLTK